jgi:hypothetical protein
MGTNGHYRRRDGRLVAYGGNKKSRFRDLREADDGTRTHDLPHGKDSARSDSSRHDLTFRTGKRYSVHPN